jgi:zinc protease
MKKTIIAILALAFLCAGLGLAQAKHPSELKYQPLKYEPPNPKASRTVYAGGLRAYVQEDKSLPLFNITAIVNCGDLYIPKDKTGLGRVLGDQLIKGGTAAKEGPAIEDRIDFLGGTLNFMVGERTATLSLSVLAKDLDEGLAVFFDVLRNPAFREEPLKLAKARFVEQLRQANDQPNGVLSREYEKLLYGDNAVTWQPTKATYEAITAADLKAFHAKYFSPKNMILAVSGDFAKAGSRPRSRSSRPGGRAGRSRSRPCRRPSRRRSRASISSRRPSTRATSASATSASRTPTPITSPCRS